MGLRYEPERPARIDPQCEGVAPAAAVGDELRRMFDDIVSSPMPQGLMDLCDALEDAFRRGDLHAACERKPGT